MDNISYLTTSALIKDSSESPAVSIVIFAIL